MKPLSKTGILLPAAVFLFLVLCFPRFGHCWTIGNWANAYGGQSADIGASVQPTPDGGSIVVGSTISFTDNIYENAWVLKLRPGGQVEWEKALGGDLWDSLSAVRATSDGGYIAAGNRTPPGGSQDAWVVKLTPEGSIAWEKLYGREDHFDGALSIEPTSDGGFIVVGWTQSHDLGGDQGGWVLKLTGDGEIEWQKFFGGAWFDMLFSVQQTSDGGYILAGGTFSFSEDPLYSDAWVIKLRSNGEVAWEKTYGGDFDEAAYSVRQTADGGYFLLGWTSSFGLGGGDIWVLRLDRSGRILWQKSYGGERSEVPYALQTTFDGGAVVAGSTASFGAGQEDGWILKLAATGMIQWQKTYGGVERDNFSDIRTTARGYLATGSTRSFGAGEDDVWAIDIPLSGILLWSPIDRPSAAMARNSVSTPQPITGFSKDTSITPVVSDVQVTDTDSVRTDLSNLPWIRTRSLATQIRSSATSCIPWPVVPRFEGWLQCIPPR